MMSQVGHLPFFLADPRCEVAAVAETRPSLIKALSQDARIGRIVAGYRDLLADPAIDAVLVSVPRGATAPITLEALNAGKHVLAEKPMALTLDDARRLVDAAKAKNLIYAVGFMKRYDPGVQAARATFREITAQGRLGRLLLARFYNFSKVYAVPPPAHTRPQESRVERFAEGAAAPDWLPAALLPNYGWFLNAASHDLNLMRYFLADELSVQAASSLPDGAVSVLLSHGATPVHLEVAKSAVGVWREGAEFLFENGRLNVEIPSPMAVDQVARVTVEENTAGHQTRVLETPRGWCFARQAQGFINALAGTVPPLASGEDSLGDMVLNDKIWRKIAEAA